MKLKDLFWPIALASSVIGNNDGLFKIDFDIRENKKDVAKRDGSVEMQLQNKNDLLYLTELKVGSNQDNIVVMVDTGSSDLWFMSSDVKCEAFVNQRSSSKRGRQTYGKDLKDKADGEDRDAVGGVAQTLVGNPSCTTLGTFETSKSDTFHKNDSAGLFNATYLGGSVAYGVWGTDDVSIGDVKIKDLSLGVVDQTTSNYSILGISLPGSEQTYGQSNGKGYTYENLPLKLKSQGIINKIAYSMYLGKENSNRGTILFGAVDDAKYSGDLQTVKMINTYLDYGFTIPIRSTIIVSGIKFNDSGKEIEITTNQYASILDSGTGYTYFPTSLFNKIVETLNGERSSYGSYYYVDCVYDDSYHFTIDFSGIKINLPLSNFLFQSGSQCYLTILPIYDDYILFGDNSLRSMYVVYDFEDLEISLAQAKHSSDENISIISSSIPNAKQAPNYSSTDKPNEVEEGSATETATFGENSYSHTSDPTSDLTDPYPTSGYTTDLIYPNPTVSQTPLFSIQTSVATGKLSFTLPSSMSTGSTSGGSSGGEPANGDSSTTDKPSIASNTNLCSIKVYARVIVISILIMLSL